VSASAKIYINKIEHEYIQYQQYPLIHFTRNSPNPLPPTSHFLHKVPGNSGHVCPEAKSNQMELSVGWKEAILMQEVEKLPNPPSSHLRVFHRIKVHDFLGEGAPVDAENIELSPRRTRFSTLVSQVGWRA
jgi:hypothetical protein